MNPKISKAHAQIEGTLIAQIIIDFNREFRDVYPTESRAHMCAVGPLQSLIGHAIASGHLQLGPLLKKGSNELS